MRSSFPVSFTEVSPLNKEILAHICQSLLDTPYNGEDGFGFREVQSYDQFVTATLVKRTPTFISQLDTATGQLNEHKIFLYSKSKFGIDYQYGLLEIYGSAQQISKVRPALRGILPKECKLSTVTLILSETIKALSSSSDSILVDNLTVNNFRYREGVIGKYVMRIATFHLAEIILQEYVHDVLNAHIQIIGSPVGDFSLQLSRSGHLVIKCDELGFVDVFSYLKSVIFSAREE